MNIYQRIILIVGAIVFTVVLLTSPKMGYVDSALVSEEYVRRIAGKDKFMIYALITDVRTASVRGVTVLGAAALVWFALKGIK